MFSCIDCAEHPGLLQSAWVFHVTQTIGAQTTCACRVPVTVDIDNTKPFEQLTKAHYACTGSGDTADRSPVNTGRIIGNKQLRNPQELHTADCTHLTD